MMGLARSAAYWFGGPTCTYFGGTSAYTDILRQRTTVDGAEAEARRDRPLAGVDAERQAPARRGRVAALTTGGCEVEISVQISL